MVAYKKQGGVWQDADRVYVSLSGKYQPANQVYVKHAGIWKLAHDYDVTPPPAPLVSLEIVDTDPKGPAEGRYIKVGVRTPGAHEPDVKLIRVLTTYNGKMPTTPMGGGYHAQPADSDPNEPWSDFHYNGYLKAPAGRQTNDWKYKRFPRNATNTTNLGAGTKHFAVWVQDMNGNWSQGTFAQIDVPKRGVESANIKVKEARFMAETGTWSKGNFTYGRPVQADGPIRRGLFFYGGVLRYQIGSEGKPTVRRAQIRLERRPNDTGKARANLYLAYHNYGTPGGFSDGSNWKGATKIGELSKGESKWFDLPKSWYEAIEKDEVKGFILLHKNPAKSKATANDYSVMNSNVDSPRSGELHVVWAEKL